MLELVLGISGSGKSSRIIKEITDRAKAGQRSILLVPEQFTSSTEKRIYYALGDELSGFVESYSFSSLAEHLLQVYGGAAVQTISDAGRIVLLRRAVESLGDKVVYYRRHRRNAAFCRLAAETINELKSAGLTGETLAEHAKEAGTSSEKLMELALIFSAYEALLQGNAMDPGDRLELAADYLNPDDLAGTKVFVDEFDTFNAPKKKLLGRLMQACDVQVALCANNLLPDYEDALFSGAKKVARGLRQLAEQLGVKVKNPVEILENDLRHGETALGKLNLLLAGDTEQESCRTEQITLYKASSRLDEARAVAAMVRRKAEEGIPYGKMAVICRNSEDYLSAVRYAFRLADIPLFFDEPATPENTAPALAVKAAVELLRRGMTSENILALIKSGLCDMDKALALVETVKAETEAQYKDAKQKVEIALPDSITGEDCRYALENYAYTWPLRADDWRRPFAITKAPSGYDGDPNKDDAQNLILAECARRAIVPPIEEFLRVGGKTAMGISKNIYCLLEKLGAETALERLAEKLRTENGIPAAEEALREWNVVAANLLNAIGLLLQEDKVTPEEYGELFTLLLRSTDLGHIPETLDAVIFTTAGRMRLDDARACFVMGLSEGEFPQSPGEKGLLTHSDRDLLISRGVEMPDCFENRLVREKICFYKALTAAKEYLWLSWPGENGGPELTDALSDTLAVFAPEAPLLSRADMAPTPASALDELGRCWQRDNTETAALYRALEKEPAAAYGLDTMRRTALELPFAAHDRESLEQVLGGKKELFLTPSRVETFYKCRFGYFMRYVLKVNPRHKAELSPSQSGSLVHWVLENALRDSGEAFKDLSPEALELLAEQLVERYVAENMPESGSRFQYLISRIKRNAVALLHYLQKDMRQSSFTPVAFEQKIGMGEGEVPPVTLETQDGHIIRVVGTIDRVDSMQRDGVTWLRVVDYKTGNKEFRLDEVFCGLDCQMLLYLFTLTRNGGGMYPNPSPAGVLYLLADPSVPTAGRNEAKSEKVYKLDGIILEDETIIRAMDRECTGMFVPTSFTSKGVPRSKSKLADLAKMGRICKHIDELVIEMAMELYRGEIDAKPLCKEKNSPCQYCDYRSICRHEDGCHENQVTMPEHYFDHDREEEKDGKDQMDTSPADSH